MRVHSIKTTYLIHETIVKNATVKELIPEDNVFLCIGEENTPYPYVVITRNSIENGTWNKDSVDDEVRFNIKVYSDKYDVGVDIADAIRMSIENHILRDSLIEIDNIFLISSYEKWNGYAYEQNMDFTCEVRNI